MYDEREEELGDELMRELERFLLLQIIDDAWREHLHDMDYLREGIHLRGFAQIEPIIAYKNEAFTLFQELSTRSGPQFAQLVFNVQIEVEEQLQQPERRAHRRPPLEPAGGGHLRVRRRRGPQRPRRRRRRHRSDRRRGRGRRAAPAGRARPSALNREQRRQLAGSRRSRPSAAV